MFTIIADDTIPTRSHRASESLDNYLGRLKRAHLTKLDRNDIRAIYDRLDAEWLAEGYAHVPERAPWTAADILELRDLSDADKYRDLKGYARLCDRYAGRTPQQPARLAA